MKKTFTSVSEIYTKTTTQLTTPSSFVTRTSSPVSQAECRATYPLNPPNSENPYNSNKQEGSLDPSSHPACSRHLRGASQTTLQSSIFQKSPDSKPEEEHKEIEIKFNCSGIVRPPALKSVQNSLRIKKKKIGLELILKLFSSNKNGSRKDVYIDQTELRRGTTNPKFVKPISLFFEPELNYTLKAAIYHRSRDKFEQEDVLVGEVEFEYQDLIENPLKGLKLTLRREGRFAGRLEIWQQFKGVEQSELRIAMEMTDFFEKKISTKESLFFLRFLRPLNIYGNFNNVEEVPKDAWILAKDTKPSKAGESIYLQISPENLCLSNDQNWIKIEVHELKPSASSPSPAPLSSQQTQLRPKKVATGYFILKDLISAEDPECNICIRTFKNTPSGSKKEIPYVDIDIKSVQRTGLTTFRTFLENGLKFNISYLIDLSSSNLDLGDPGCLHTLLPKNGMNVYEESLSKISPIFEQLNSKVSIFGSGFSFASEAGEVQCYPLNHNLKSPTVNRVTNVLKTYRKFVDRKIRLNGDLDLIEYLKVIYHTTKRRFMSDCMAYSIGVVFFTGKIAKNVKNVKKGKSEAITKIRASLHNQTVPKSQLEQWIRKLSALPVSLYLICLDQSNFNRMAGIVGRAWSDEPSLILRRPVNAIPFAELSWDDGVLEREILRNLPSQVTNFYHQCVLNNPNMCEVVEDDGESSRNGVGVVRGGGGESESSESQSSRTEFTRVWTERKTGESGGIGVGGSRYGKGGGIGFDLDYKFKIMRSVSDLPVSGGDGEFDSVTGVSGCE